MKYAIKQKLFSLAESFTIKDQQGNDAFMVKGKLFSLKRQLRLLDMSENELCLIKQKLFKLMPQYDIFAGGQLRANVRKNFALFRNNFTIAAGAEVFTVEGNFVGFEFSIMKSGSKVAHISKKFFAWTDTYGVDILEGEDAVLLLAIAIIIDMVCHNNRKSG
jgi:uncharacterized protein YxjI